MDRSDLDRLITELHGDTLTALDRALGRGPAILLARVGDGERQLVEQYQRAVVTVDATLFPDRTSLRFELLRATVTHLLSGNPALALADPGPRGDAARLTLADAYGEWTEHVMALIERSSPPVLGQFLLSVNDVLAGLDDDVAVVVFDAHRLDTDARWDLRELERPLLLVTRPDHYAQMTGADAPFYGNAQTVTLHAPGPAEWMRVLTKVGYRIQATDLEWLLDRSRGRVMTTVTALELGTSERSLRSAWHRAVSMSLPRAHDILALTREIHAYAPVLLLAIAEARKPYLALPDAPSARIARALNKMRSLDILEQPEPRTWQIADPLIEHAFRSINNGDRVRQAMSGTLDTGDWPISDAQLSEQVGAAK